ncbi:pilus (MSHA type) biogenesis protein MshL [Oleiphilus messinensis]|uniref:pilus (MSHA type) biogenesis protein MshL n=1 Tax=Oleiphilus messinensis TaxID=141451 RepID=UPI000B3BA056|nr:pilus (MSHA type) biogenesis protein MshL [Oleiphilus messinensis]
MTVFKLHSEIPSGPRSAIRCSVSNISLVACLCASVLLSGCESIPTSRAHDSDSAREIVTTLDQAISETVQPDPEPVQPDDAVMAALLPSMLSGTIATQVPEIEDERFDLVANSMDAATFFRSLVRGTDYNIVVHPQVSGIIDLELSQVTVPEVMAVVKDLYGFHYELKDRMYKVVPNGLRTEVFQINYLNLKRRGDSETQVSAGQVSSVETSSSNSSSNQNTRETMATSSTSISTSTESDFWTELRETVEAIIGDGEKRKVLTTRSAGMLVVRAFPDELESVRNYLERAELILQRQVILEAKILEVELSDGYQQGISWSSLAEYGNGYASNGDPEKYLFSQLGSKSIENVVAGGVFGATLQIKDFSAFIELLGTQGNVQVLSSPRIATVNNQKAVIKVGTDEFFVTDIEINDNTNTSTSRESTDIELTPFFSGISLDVTPQISEVGNVILHVHPSISEVEDQTKVISLGDQQVTLPLALSTIRETDSIISARNGQIVVIGGLIQNINREHNATTPFLGDIPVLGEMFKQKRQQATRSELVILLKPTIVDDTQFQSDLMRSRERFRSFRNELSQPPQTHFR